MARIFMLIHSLENLCLLYILLDLTYALESGEGSGSFSGSGETPTNILSMCDDEDSACDPTTHPSRMLATGTIKESSLPTPAIVTMAPTTSSVPMYSIAQPRFQGNSFMVLPRLPLSSRRSVELSIAFKASDRNGLLLYSGRRSQRKDFLAVGLVNGFVELRFSNGADTVTLKTPNRITLGQWHRVVVLRDQRDGYLTLDYGQLVHGTTNQNQNLMNLNTPLYLGGLPEFNVVNVPYRRGLNGCVRELVIDGKRLDLRLPGRVSKNSSNIDDCNSSTKTCLCKNGGTCQYNSRGEWLCACPLGTAGQHCEREVTLEIPSFNGHSFLSYPSTGKVALKSFAISVTLKPAAETGLILLDTDSTKSNGDFFSLSLREGIVEFMFDCGSGPVLIRSIKPIMMGEWHTITIWRVANQGSITIDDGLPVYSKSLGRLHHMNLNGNLFVGGMQDYKYQRDQIEMDSGFVGCIQKVTINFIPLNLTSPLSGVNVDNCDHVCVRGPLCQNGGTCQPDMEHFQCSCAVGYTGILCEKKLNIKMPLFTGQSFLSYPSLGQQVYNSFVITLVLQPRKDTGLILYAGQSDNQKGDYFSLALRKGFVEFSFDCGSGAAKLRSATKIMANQWYTITISRYLNQGKLVIDGGTPVLRKSPGAFRYITLKGDLYLGGMEHVKEQPLDHAVTTGFDGCIQKVTVNSDTLDLSSFRSGVNIDNYDHVCLTHYVCLNGGKCLADMDDFKCQCTAGYTGVICGKATRNTQHFDGNLLVKITRKKILRRISGSNTNIRLQVKTSSSQSIILYVQPKSKTNTYLLICLNNGKLEVRYKNGDNKEETITSKQRVNDSLWHNLHFISVSSKWSLKVDNDITTVNKTLSSDSSTFRHGDMFLGGLPSDTVLSWPNFKGSLKGLLIFNHNVNIRDESVVSIEARRYRISNI